MHLILNCTPCKLLSVGHRELTPQSERFNFGMGDIRVKCLKNTKYLREIFQVYEKIERRDL